MEGNDGLMCESVGILEKLSAEKASKHWSRLHLSRVLKCSWVSPGSLGVLELHYKVQAVPRP